MSGPLAGFVKDKVRLLTLLILIPAGMSFFAPFHWAIELSSHFLPHYCVALMICCVALLCLRDRLWSGAAAVGAILAAVPVIPWYFGSDSSRTSADGTPLRILLSNVYTANAKSSRLLELLKTENADLAVLQEVDGRWVNELEPLKKTLPEVKVIAREDNFGIGVWSRFKLEQVQIVEMGPFEVPTSSVELDVGGKRVSLMATHPVPPASAEGAQGRDAQLHDLAEKAANSKVPVIAVGDLNTTMWAPAYRRFEKKSGLKNVRRGFGVLPTWPAQFRWVGIPLDQCLVSPEIQVANVRLGRPIGSDHLPLVVDLLIRKPAGNEPAP